MTFEELVKRLTPKLKRITYKLNVYFSYFNDEDLYQEALMQLWQDYSAGRLNDKTDSYILQGCFFHLKNYLRKNYARINATSLEENYADSEASDLSKVLCIKDRRFCLDEINSNLIVDKINHDGLTAREKEVFLLALRGFTTREIGNKIGISHVRVVKLKKRIKEKCQKYFDFI